MTNINQEAWDEDLIWKDVFTKFCTKYKLDQQPWTAVMLQYKSLVDGAKPFDIMLLPDEPEIILYTIDLLSTKMPSYDRQLLVVTPFRYALKAFNPWTLNDPLLGDDPHIEFADDDVGVHVEHGFTDNNVDDDTIQ